jgi:hypothetical protein
MKNISYTVHELSLNFSGMGEALPTFDMRRATCQC